MKYDVSIIELRVPNNKVAREIFLNALQMPAMVETVASNQYMANDTTVVTCSANEDMKHYGTRLYLRATREEMLGIEERLKAIEDVNVEVKDIDMVSRENPMRKITITLNGSDTKIIVSEKRCKHI